MGIKEDMLKLVHGLEGLRTSAGDEDDIRKLDRTVIKIKILAEGDDILLLSLLTECGNMYLQWNSNDKGALVFEETLKIADQLADIDPYAKINVLRNLGRTYQAINQRYNDAIRVLTRLVSLCTASLGRSHLETGFALIDLATVHAMFFTGTKHWPCLKRRPQFCMDCCHLPIPSLLKSISLTRRFFDSPFTMMRPYQSTEKPWQYWI